MIELPLTVIIPAVAAWTGILIGIIKWLLSRFLDQIEDRFRRIDERDGDRKAEQDTASREISGLRSEMYRDYVRREDWIHFGGTIDAKLDALNRKIDKAILSR